MELACVLISPGVDEHTAIRVILTVGDGASRAVHQLVSCTSAADTLTLLGIAASLLSAGGRQADSIVALGRAGSREVGSVEGVGCTHGGEGEKTGDRVEVHLDGITE